MKKIQKISGVIAKHFVCEKPGYAYPLFKTHKISPNILHTISVFDIPIRLLQSAGNITTSKITAFLESIFQPISVEFCKAEFDEYCRDSKQYLLDVDDWKKNNTNVDNRNLYIVAADVKSLYPSISRSIVKEALAFALNKFSSHTRHTVTILVDLAMYCLENVIIQHKTKFYAQHNGIITGDNHSVSLANITLHYIILPIANIIKEAVLFKRFIDDIIWFSYGKDTTQKIQDTILKRFSESNLQLSFRVVNSSQIGSCIEFLDVEHRIDPRHNFGFYTRDYVKPTAVGRTFINGKSFHPHHIYKSIVFSEAIRLRRLNECQEEFIASLKRLREKCDRSGFHTKITTQIIDLATSWKQRFSPDNISTQRKLKQLVWPTSFTNFIKLKRNEKKLVPNARVVYKRPTTLQGILTNYTGKSHTILIHVILEKEAQLLAISVLCVVNMEINRPDLWLFQLIVL